MGKLLVSSPSCPPTILQTESIRSMQKAKIPFKSGRKVCIFCGRTPVTEEHLWPQWCRSLMPPGDQHHFMTFEGVVEQPAPKKHYRRQGPVTSVRIPRVCGPCNSGWMNQYEGLVRPFMSKMMTGQRTDLTPEQRKTLSEYITYKFLILDWYDRDPVLDEDAAHEFYRSRKIPAHTQIYALNCVEGGWRSAHRSAEVHLSPLDEPSDPESKKNSKVTAVGFGNLFILAFLSTRVDIDIEIDWRASLRLWPPLSESPVRWPPLMPISSLMADELSMMLFTAEYGEPKAG